MSRPLRVLILEDRPADTELRRTGFDPEWRRVETEADCLAALEAIPAIPAKIRNLLNGKTARFSMESRARVIGATIAMENPGEGGFRVTCRIPV